jgi:hypothetical protein
MPNDANKVEIEKIWLPLLLAVLLPGAGHLYLKKYARAGMLFGAIGILLLAGVLLSGEMYTFFAQGSSQGFLQTMGAIGNLGLGSLHFLFIFAGNSAGVPAAVGYEYGTTFILIASLLNVLVVLDVFDIARGAKK